MYEFIDSFSGAVNGHDTLPFRHNINPGMVLSCLYSFRGSPMTGFALPVEPSLVTDKTALLLVSQNSILPEAGVEL